MEENKTIKRQRVYKTIMLIIVTIFITFISTTLYITNKYNLSDGNILSYISSSNDNKLTQKINYVKTILNQYYLNEIDTDAMNDGALKGYVEALDDPYTEYIPADEMEDYTTSITGNYVGIGIYMSVNTEKNTIVILSPIVDSPAYEAGILPGDTIISVDGVKCTGDDMNAVSNKIKGEEGTKVKLEILRNQEIKTFEITRRKVATNPVIAEVMDNNIGYIQISSFDVGTAEDFKNKFEKLQSQGIKSLIIDIRNNGGGLVDETLEIADYIVPKGNELLITVDKDGNEKIQKAEEDVLIDMPIVVLVNENSASASEILAGALKDNNEATIIGTKTYGKGVIQQIFKLQSGDGLKVTIQEYYTPKRNKINGIGIEPDELVNLPDTVKSIYLVEEDEDTQLQKAIELLK